MNYSHIQRVYPKAFEHLNMISSREIHNIKTRDLYDFFDVNNLIVRITWEYTNEKVNWCWMICWHKRIENCPTRIMEFFDFAQCTGINGIDGEYKKRSKAEEAAFEKAFELLDKRLNGIDIDKL